eukprot:SAG31_NODE_12700_length_923_cov_1.425971_1_plen_90_part_00
MSTEERPLAAYVAEPVLQPVLSIADVEIEVMRVTLKDTQPHDFFGALFSDTSDFQERICKERGDDNFSCGEDHCAVQQWLSPRDVAFID